MTTARITWFFLCVALARAARIADISDEEDDLGVEEMTEFEAGDDEHPSLYLNFVVMSTQKVIDAKVAEMRRPARRIARHVLQKKVTGDMVAEKLVTALPATLPGKMAEMGIDADAHEVFRQGAFAIIRVTIRYANMTKLMPGGASAASQGEAANAGTATKAMGTALGWGKSVASWFGMEEKLDNAVNDAFTRKVASLMCQKLGEILPKKLAEKGLGVQVTALLEEDERDFFWEAMTQPVTRQASKKPGPR